VVNLLLFLQFYWQVQLFGSNYWEETELRFNQMVPPGSISLRSDGTCLHESCLSMKCVIKFHGGSTWKT
jgi:hypothetical protein